MSTDRASAVLDASALLAFLDSEPGADVVLRALIAGSYVSTVNMAEVYTKNASKPVPLQSIEARLSLVRLVLEPFPRRMRELWDGSRQLRDRSGSPSRTVHV